MGFTSPWHWAIVLVVLVLLFGSKRLPDAARGIGRSLRIFKSEMKEMTGDDQPVEPESAGQPAPPAQLPAAVVTPPAAAPHVPAPHVPAPPQATVAQQPAPVAPQSAAPQAGQVPPATAENSGS